MNFAVNVLTICGYMLKYKCKRIKLSLNLIACFYLRGEFMKKIISIVTLICLLVSLCGCGKNNDEANANSNIPQNKSEEPTTLPEGVFVDQENIKISLETQEKRLFGLALVILIDNKSERDISVSTDNYSVNDYMIKGSDYETVLAGKKNHIEIFISNSDLNDYKIDKDDPYEFDFKITVKDKDTWAWSIETGEITLNINS